MDIVKKFGLYIVAVVLAGAALGFYFVAVRSIEAKHRAKVSGHEERRRKLGDYARKTVYNEASIEAARKAAEQEEAQLGEAELVLARQPRNAHTRRFFENEISGPEKEILPSVAWLDAYDRNNRQLREQLDTAGFTGFGLQTLHGSWGNNVPTDEQIRNAMELFWYQKDMADFLTEQVEPDFNEFIHATADRPDAFPAKVSDLVINRRPARLDELLRLLPNEKREKLVEVLLAMLINPHNMDLATIFNTYLPEFPWDRATADAEQHSVLGVTMDDVQRQYLAALVPPEKPDLSNRRRFVNYVMELRTVRYRTDVIGLLENRGFEELAESLRRGTEEEFARVRQEVNTRSRAWLAQAIAAIVSIRDEKDYRLVRNNHRHGIVELASIAMRHATSGVGAEAGASQSNDLYKVSTFDMRVKLRFDHIPVFLRRLLDNSWRYHVRITSVTPADSSAQGAASPATPVGGFGGLGGLGGLMPAGPRNAPALGASRPQQEETREEALDTRHYFWVEIKGEAHQFTPVLEKVRHKLMPPAPGAEANDAAQPAGAR